MADEQVKPPRDLSRVSLDDDEEMRYWTAALGVSPEQLRALVRRHGDSVDAIKIAIRH
jgi:hypothetical protein